MITEDILVKYLAGESEAHEVALIDKWRQASGENEKQFQQLKTLWDSSAGLKHTQEVNVDDAWEKVHTKMELKGRGSARGINTRWLVAASLVLLIGLGIFFIARHTGDQVQMIVMHTSGAARKIKLEDGSRLLVKSGEVTYPAGFDRNKRKMKLNAGKVFFEIAQDKSRPFEIEANKTLITVLGTEFEIVSYADYTQVMVKEGRVRFSTPAGETVLTAGMAAKYMQKENRLENLAVKGNNTFAYASGRLVFENDRLGNVITDINQYFDSEVILEDPALADCLITSSFSNEKLENVLAVIAGTLNLEVEHVPNSNKVVLKGKVCRP